FRHDPLSARDNHIADLIAHKLVRRGLTLVSNMNEADLAVLYRSRVEQGVVGVWSSPDFVWGGQNIESSARYPRIFEIAIIDVKNHTFMTVFIWSGKVKFIAWAPPTTSRDSQTPL
ncbi:MAG: hypothetical protein QXS54_08140, partial [Candidatus Methanomethylicaceae archaeon]